MYEFFEEGGRRQGGMERENILLKKKKNQPEFIKIVLQKKKTEFSKSGIWNEKRKQKNGIQ